jgi:hypothetical protein
MRPCAKACRRSTEPACWPRAARSRPRRSTACWRWTSNSTPRAWASGWTSWRLSLNRPGGGAPRCRPLLGRQHLLPHSREQLRPQPRAASSARAGPRCAGGRASPPAGPGPAASRPRHRAGPGRHPAPWPKGRRPTPRARHGWPPAPCRRRRSCARRSPGPRWPRPCSTASGGVSLCSSGMPLACGPWKRTTATKSPVSSPA